VLERFPDVEGGFYLGGRIDRFSGYAFPTGRKGPAPDPYRTDPPPLEAPYIRLQAQQSLSDQSADPLLTTRDVGPSKVVVVTERIGRNPVVSAATWAMFRLTGPEQLGTQLSRYQFSIGLALVGLAISLILTLNLRRSLRMQREEQERLRDDLRRSEQLATLGRLLAGVAHEIRNPLAGIRSTIQLWQRLPETARTEDSLQAVVLAVDRLNEILSRLLYFARADHAEREPLQINQLVTDVFKLTEAQAAAQGVILELDLDPALPLVQGAPAALRQAVLNLAVNGLQAMPAGGHLRCRTRFVERTVEVVVSDTGSGISPDDRAHLFEPFFTTRPEGTGLGLALCREIVHQHGGRIVLDQVEGWGATFRIVLPAVEQSQK
jgi:signal transduction histidine kinase